MGKYAVLKSSLITYDWKSDDNHIFIHTKVKDQEYSLAVNVQSNVAISRMYYCLKTYPITPNPEQSRREQWLSYWVEQKDGIVYPYESRLTVKTALHYRDGWFEEREMVPAEDEDTFKARTSHRQIDLGKNELAGKLVLLLNHVMKEEDSFIVSTGVQWGPKQEKDWTFGFYPATGLHDIHENENGADGAIFFYDMKEKKVTGVFTKFVRI